VPTYSVACRSSSTNAPDGGFLVQQGDAVLVGGTATRKTHLAIGSIAVKPKEVRQPGPDGAGLSLKGTRDNLDDQIPF